MYEQVQSRKDDAGALATRIPKADSIVRGRSRGPVWTFSLVVIVLFGILAIFGFRERRAARQVREIITELRNRDQPVDNETIEAWFASQTSPAGTLAWHEILQTMQSDAPRSGLPVFGEPALPDQIEPGSNWPEEAAVAEYLRQMEPVLGLLERAREYPTPVWQPIQFNGFMTLLEPVNWCRSVSRLAQLEVEYAAYHQDAERSLKGLASMKLVADAFDWQFCAVTELVHLALLNAHLNTVCRTLSVEMFNASDVQRLREQVGGPLDVRSSFRNTMSGERAMMLASLGGTRNSLLGVFDEFDILSNWRVQFPSGRLQYLQMAARMEELADQGLPNLVASSDALEHELLVSNDTFTKTLVPAIKGFSVALHQNEFRHRVTVMALAVKEYQLTTGNWPKTAADLDTVGLARADRVDLDGRPIEFSEDEEGVTLGGTLPFSESYDENDMFRVNGMFRVRVANRGSQE